MIKINYNLIFITITSFLNLFFICPKLILSENWAFVIAGVIIICAHCFMIIDLIIDRIKSKEWKK
jgi:hypothetical protein